MTENKSIIDKRRLLHTMLRVGDMQKSINFYTQILGMHVLRMLDRPDEKYTLTFIGYESEEHSSVIELTYNYGITEYKLGEGFGHVAIAVNDCKKACDEITSHGGNVTLEATPLKGSDEIIAFVLDPDGYQVELIQRPSKQE